MQQLIHDRALFTPIWQLAAHAGVGPKIAESGLGLIPRYPFSAPYEDVELKSD
jgi:peptide/nickel transport system substrate-binding protein